MRSIKMLAVMMKRPDSNTLPQITSIMTLGATLLLLLLLMAYSLISKKSSDVPELERNIALWEKNEPESYSYTVNPSCFCVDFFSYSIIYSGGKNQVAPLENQADWYANFQSPETPLSVDNLFKLARRALNGADRVDITYDQVYGFPVRIEIDWIIDAIDDEYSVEISSFGELSQ